MKWLFVIPCLWLSLGWFCYGVQAAPLQEPTVSAQSAVVIDGFTGEVLFEKNADQQRSMASTTKIMTTLLALEQNDPNREIVTTKEMVTVEGSGMGLLAGDHVTLQGLCYGMMLASGNDAANTVALSLSNSFEEFAEKMNQKAKQIGMRNTRFVTPSGLDADGHYSTAYDMATLMQYALNNPDFCKISQTVSTRVTYGNPPYERKLTNHHRLLKEYDGCLGGKTGFTKKSGRCLVTAARRNGATLICVTLSAPDDWNDHKSLLDYGFAQMESVTISPRAFDLPVVGGTVPKIPVTYQALQVSIPSAHRSKLSVQTQIAPFLYAPIEADETVGIQGVFFDGRLLMSTPITAVDSAKQLPPAPSFWEQFWQNLCRWLLP
ncbi:MAG: D-alanyl-D-alanine carboxypeptidase [Clostridia bacterium]|nr:D-alanyl-D-alanine carboxypeptidase [Clostridia bacterium]